MATATTEEARQGAQQRQAVQKQLQKATYVAYATKQERTHTHTYECGLVKPSARVCVCVCVVAVLMQS